MERGMMVAPRVEVAALGGTVPEPLTLEELGIKDTTQEAVVQEDEGTPPSEQDAKENVQGPREQGDAGVGVGVAAAAERGAADEETQLTSQATSTTIASNAVAVQQEMAAPPEHDAAEEEPPPAVEQSADALEVVAEAASGQAVLPGSLAAARPDWMPPVPAADYDIEQVAAGTAAAARAEWTVQPVAAQPECDALTMPAVPAVDYLDDATAPLPRVLAPLPDYVAEYGEAASAPPAEIAELAAEEADEAFGVASAPPLEATASEEAAAETAMPRFLFDEQALATATAYIEPVRLSEAERKACYSNNLLERDLIVAQEHFSDAARRTSSLHPLWQVLEHYRKMRLQVMVANTELAELNASVAAAVSGVWQITSEKAEVSGKCDCGNTVSGQRDHETAAFDAHAHTQLSRVLKESRTSHFEHVVSAMNNARVAKYHVEGYLSAATARCSAKDLSASSVSFVAQPNDYRQSAAAAAAAAADVLGGRSATSSRSSANSSGAGPAVDPGHLLSSNWDSREKTATELRECIKVLHWFIRGSSISARDNGFAFEVNGWMEHLSAALLTLASLDDHRFLLQAVVRCGAGLNESLTKCLHLPRDPRQWDNGMVDHALALLACMLAQVNPPARCKRTTSDLEMVDLFQEQLNGAENTDDLRNVGELIQGAKEEGVIADDDLKALRDLYVERAAALNSSTTSPTDIAFDNSGNANDGSDRAKSPGGADGENKGSGKLGDSHYAALLDCFPLGQLLQFVLRLPMQSQMTDLQGEDAACHHGGWRTAGATAAAAPHSEHSVVEVFAFVDALLRVLFTGFAGLGGAEFPLLTLRAGRAISDIFASLAQYWETAPNLADIRSARPDDDRSGIGDSSTDSNVGGGEAPPVIIISAAQVELDQLFMRTMAWFFSDPLEAIWPFIAELPYKVLSAPAAWRTLCFLFTGGQASLGGTPHVEWQALVQQKVLRERFADSIMLMPHRSAEYMLTTLANLARTRQARPDNADGRAFVEAVFYELFALACLNPQTRDSFLRCIRDQLACIASTHPFVLSTLIGLLDTHFGKVGKVAIYILRAMPLNVWHPTTQNIRLVQSWLEQPLGSPENESAREVINLLDLKHRPADHTRMGVPPDIHADLAVAISHGYKIAIDASALQGHRRGAAAAAGALLGGTEIQTFETWCWEVLLTLEPWKASAPEDYENATRLDKLRECATRVPVIACAVLLVSTAGRTAMPFRDYGVNLVTTLVTSGKYEAAIYCLTFALPSVVQSATQPADIATNAVLVRVLEMLVQADRSTVPLGDRLLFSKEYTVELMLVGLIRSNLYSMSSSAAYWQQPQHLNHPQHQQLAFRRMTEFWLQLIFSCDAWFSNEVARRLADLVLAATFGWGDGRVVAQGLMELSHSAAVKDAAETRAESRKGVSGVFRWISGAGKYDGDILSFAAEKSADGYVDTVASLFKSRPAHDAGSLQPIELRRVSTCLVFESLIMETRKEATVRKETGAALLLGGTKASLEEVSKARKMSIGSFRVFRWAHYCTVLDPEESMLPVFWQIFFSLYFSSSRTTTGRGVENQCYGHLFFATGLGAKLLALLTARLAFLADWHASASNGEIPASSNIESGIEGDPADGSQCEWSCTRMPFVLRPRPPRLHNGLAQLYTAMLGWLSKGPSALHDFASMPDAHLQPHSSGADTAKRFISVIYDEPWKATESQSLWRDLLPRELDSHAEPFREAELSRRAATLNVPTQGIRGKIGGSLLTRNRSADFEGVPFALTLIQPAAIDAHIMADRTRRNDPNTVYQLFEEDLAELSAMASLYRLQLSNVVRLDEQYLHALPALRVNDPQQVIQKVKCVKRIGSPCLGPATITFELTQQRVVASVKRDIAMNRKEAGSQLDGPPVPESCNKAAYRVLSRVESLLMLVKAGVSGTEEHAVKLFYRLVRIMDEEIMLHPPSRTVYERSVQCLGRSVIAGNALQMTPLLDLCIERPDQTFLLQPFFNPALCVDLYSQLYVSTCNKIALQSKHVGALLERFDVREWLANSLCTPGLRSSFVQVVCSQIEAEVNDSGTRARSGIAEDSLHVEHILQQHRNNLDRMTQDCYPQQFGDVLRSLVGASSRCNVPDECWMTFLATVAANQRLLPLEEQWNAALWLEQTFNAIRSASGSLFTVFAGATMHICQLYRFLLQCAVTAPGTQVEGVFTLIGMLFRPWLSTVTVTVQGQQDHCLQPWPHTTDEISSATDMLNELLRVVGVLTPLNYTMSAAWRFYVQALVPRAEPYVLNTVHTALDKMPWGSLQINPAELEDMLTILQPTAAASAYLFTASIICKGNLGWDVDAAAASYHAQLFAVMLRTSSHASVAQSFDTDAFRAVIQSCSWQHLQPEGYAIALSDYERECDVSGMFQGATSAFNGLSLLRSAVAVQHSDQDPSSVEKFRLYSGLYCRLILRGGEHVTNANLVWLLNGLLDDIHAATGATFENLACSAFRLLNGFQVGTPRLHALVGTAISWVEREPKHALTLLRVTCGSVAAIPEMAAIAEACIAQHVCFAASRGRAMAGPGMHLAYWNDVCLNLSVPELMYDEFIQACTKGPWTLTLYAHALQLLASASAAADHLRIMATTARWVEQMQPSLIPGQTEHIFLLWAKVLELAENVNAGGVLSQATAAQETVLKMLVASSEHRSSSGISGFFGLGAYQYIAEVRLFCRTLAASTAGRIVTSEGTQKCAAKLLQSIGALKKEVAKKDADTAAAQRRLDVATAFQVGSKQRSSKTLIGRMVDELFKDVQQLDALRLPAPTVV